MVEHENIDEHDIGSVQAEEQAPRKAWQEAIEDASPEATEQLQSVEGGTKNAEGMGANFPEDHPQSQQPVPAHHGRIHPKAPKKH